LGDYLVKALREGKEHSNWLSPDEPSEQVYRTFAESLLKPGHKNIFLKELLVLQKRIARLGLVNSLSQTLLKIATPGLPDFYQGTELWDFSMVDPDNRRPVDFALRQKILAEIGAAYDSNREKLLGELVERPEDGRIKLFLIWKGLEARKDKAELFQKGEYNPLEFEGSRREMAFGFARTLGDAAALIVVPRLFAKAAGEEARYPMGSFWEDTSLGRPEARGLVDVFTGQQFPAEKVVFLRDVFRDLPFALLVSRLPNPRRTPENL
jgi:(1->4)-alpha-D-glucan 1-alpha-D-glucosylmutase